MLFAATWSTKEAYIAFTDAKILKLYKIQLSEETPSATANEEPQNRNSTQASVCVPRNKVQLPKSAEDRTVQFFPGTGGDQERSMLVVHGRSGKEAAAPCVVYLDEQDLGGWMDVAEV